MVNEAAAMLRAPLVQGLFESVQDKAGVRRTADPPADDAPGIGVDDEGDVGEARPGGDVGEVRQPQPVGRWRMKLAVHMVQRTRGGLVADGRTRGLATDHPLEAHLAHQPLHGATRDSEPFPQQLTPDLAHAVDGEVVREDAGDLGLQLQVALGSSRQLAGIAPLRHVLAIGRRGDRQHLADRLDPVGLAVIIDEGDHRLNRRSSFAWAK